MCLFLVAGLGATGFCADLPYPIVGTGQTKCYDNRSEIAPPKIGQPFYGQDAQHPGLPAHYRDNGDGTISDLNTGLMWVKARGERSTWDSAIAGRRLAGLANTTIGEPQPSRSSTR